MNCFFPKQLLKNIFLPHLDFLKLFIYKYLIILVNNLNNNLSYGSKTHIQVTLSTLCKYFIPCKPGVAGSIPGFSIKL